MRTVRLFLLGETAGFACAALTHLGILADGYRHRQAATAESLIGGVLLLGWLITFGGPSWGPRVATAVQAFALFGTLVGIFTMVIGVGPRTVPDVAFHIFIVATLVSGLTLLKQLRTADETSQVSGRPRF